MADDLTELFTAHGQVEAMKLDDRFQEHLAERSTYRKHIVSLTEVLEVHAGSPEYFLNESTGPGRAKIVMVGPTLAGRFLCIPLEPTDDFGIWRPKTAFEANQHHIDRYMEK